MISILLIASADLQQKGKDNLLQALCMHRLTGLDHSPHPVSALIGMHLQKDHVTPHEPCRWDGVECIQGRVVSLQWGTEREREAYDRYKTYRSSYLIKSISWVPQAVINLNLSQQNINSSVDTRCLPRKLVVCEMPSCGITGRIELRTLPPEVTMLRLERNKLVGEVRLTALPNELVLIDLSQNLLKRVFVCNERLPKSLQQANFCEMQKEVRIACLDSDQADNRVKTVVEKFLHAVAMG